MDFRRRVSLLALGAWVLLLSGCFREELTIVLNKDGSGEYHIRWAYDIDPIMRPIAEKPRKAVTAKEMSEGPVKCTLYKVYEDTKDPALTWTEAVYKFDNLAEALPILESRIKIGPRYTFRGDRLVIFLDKEPSEYDGTSSEKMRGEARLTMKLPAPPESANGKVTGNEVTWTFSGEDMQRILKSDYGTEILRASIPASAIKLDLRPRLVSTLENPAEPDPRDMDEIWEAGDEPPVPAFTARIPVLNADRDEYNAKVSVLLPLKDIKLPMSYEGLTIKSFVVNGEKVPCRLNGQTSGFFDGKNFKSSYGTDTYATDAHEMLAELQFQLKSPWAKKADRLEAKVQVLTPVKTGEYSLECRSLEKPYPHLIIPGESGGVIAITQIDRRTEGSIRFTSNISQAYLCRAYLDTCYGLRYEGAIGYLPDIYRDGFAEIEKLDPQSKANGKRCYSALVRLPKIPEPPFQIVFQLITESERTECTIIMEDVKFYEN